MNGKLLKSYIKNKELLLLFLPGIAFYLVFHYAPMYGILIAFKDFKIRAGVMGSPWAGLEHFRHLFASRDFYSVFSNTMIISLYKLIFGFPAPIILALLLNEEKNAKFKKSIQTISYLPHFISWVVLASLFIQILSPSSGVINKVIRFFGFEPIYFIASPKWFRTVLVTTSIWKEIGWNSIIYLAALSGINPELYESAALDGAGRFKQAWHVTLPMLSNVITVMLILAVGRLINDDFDQIFNLYNAAVYKVGDVISTYTYRKGLVEMNYSFSTAVDLFKNVIALVLITVTNSLSKKVNDYGLY